MGMVIRWPGVVLVLGTRGGGQTRRRIEGRRVDAGDDDEPTVHDQTLKNIILKSHVENVAIYSGCDQLGYEVALMGQHVQLLPSSSLQMEEREGMDKWGKITLLSPEAAENATAKLNEVCPIVSANATKTIADLWRPLERLMKGKTISHPSLTPAVLQLLLSGDGVKLLKAVEQKVWNLHSV
ncbi:hypothetical protein COCNU_03G007150 [Cocos nucifera]|uniref:DEAH11/12 second type I KH-domain domain-containing protein n=1 Tax=Cocos nucifera TaxID=13894 RepID=A0A8K0I3B9_COCNU|nr:hypothetical protein COCNU_03G007150 [Cocos nucifera]